jgi:hypothetical protein
MNSQQTYYGSPDLQSENQALFSRLGKVRPQRVLAVPLKVRSKTAALIYADSAERGEVAINVEAIELLAQTAGLVVELVSLRARMSEAVEQAKQASAPLATTPTPPAEPASRRTLVSCGHRHRRQLISDQRSSRIRPRKARASGNRQTHQLRRKERTTMRADSLDCS